MAAALLGAPDPGRAGLNALPADDLTRTARLDDDVLELLDLVQPSQEVKETFELLGVYQIFPVVNSRAKAMNNPKAQLVLQEFLEESKGTDMRLVVIGGRVVASGSLADVMAAGDSHTGSMLKSLLG